MFNPQCYFLLSMLVANICMASEVTSTLSVKVGNRVTPSFCAVSRGTLGKMAFFVSAGMATTFSAKPGGNSSWGVSGDTPAPTIVFVDIIGNADIKVKPKDHSAVVPGATGDVAMVNSRGLPVATGVSASKATWLDNHSYVKLYRRGADNAIGSLVTTVPFSGAEILASRVAHGMYALEVAPTFQYAAVDSTEAMSWYIDNISKHWPFEVTCTPLSS